MYFSLICAHRCLHEFGNLYTSIRFESFCFIAFVTINSKSIRLRVWVCASVVLKLSMLLFARTQIDTFTINCLHFQLQKKKNWSKCLAAFFESIIEIVSHIEEFKQTWKQNLAYLHSNVDMFLDFLYFFVFWEVLCQMILFWFKKFPNMAHEEKRQRMKKNATNAGSR